MSSQNIDPHLIVGGYIGQTGAVAFRVHIVWSWFMKVGDLVILEYRGVDLEEKDRLKIGIVKDLAQGRNELAKVLWSSSDQQWHLQEHLQAVKKCP